MPFSLLTLIIFLVLYAIIAMSVRSTTNADYDERQRYMQGIAYKYSLYTLISIVLFNALIEDYTNSSWGTPLVESVILVGIALSVFMAICVFKDAYFPYSEISQKKVRSSILLNTFLSILWLYMGITKQLELIAQHSSTKFDNLDLVIGILFLINDIIIIARVIMEHLQKED